MNCTNIFTTPIWHIPVEKEEIPRIEELRKWALELEKTDKGEIKSNRNNTFHSTTNFDWYSIPHYNLLIKKLEFLPKFIFIGGWWINIQHKGDYTTQHIHPGSDLSFIWYLTDNHNSLVFDHSDYAMTRTRLYEAFKKANNNQHTDHNPLFPSRMYYHWNWNCKAGDILVFPSDTLHGTDPHNKKEPRISLAGNIIMNYP